MEKSTPEYTGTTQIFLEVDNAQYELDTVMAKAKADLRRTTRERR